MYKNKLFALLMVIGLVLLAGCEKDPLATLTTTAVTEITSISAVSGGNVTVAEDATLTARGVCWAITTKPTTASNKTVESVGEGTFTSTVTGLVSNTPYYVRAYATAGGETYYGNEVTFTTTASTELIANGDFALPNNITEYSPISLIPEWLTDDPGENSGRGFDDGNAIGWQWDGTSGIYQVVGTVPATATQYNVSFDMACSYSYWADPTFNIDVYVIFSAFTGTDPTTRVPIDSLTFVAATDPYMTWAQKTGEWVLPAGSSHAGKNMVIELEIFNSVDWGYDESWTYLDYDNVSVLQSSGK
jgi:hypothetical protein